MILELNVEQAIASAVEQALDPEKISELVSQYATKALESAIRDQFTYRGATAKLLEQKIAEAMPTDFGDMCRMADVVCKTVEEVVKKNQDDFIQRAVTEHIENLLKPLPPVMKLSEIVQQIVDSFSESDREGESQPTVIFERSSSALTSEYCDVYIDPSSDKSRYSCEYHIRIRQNKESELYECWSLEGTDVSRRIYTGPVYGAEALLFALNTSRVKIELDKTDFDDLYYEGVDD